MESFCVDVESFRSEPRYGPTLPTPVPRCRPRSPEAGQFRTSSPSHFGIEWFQGYRNMSAKTSQVAIKPHHANRKNVAQLFNTHGFSIKTKGKPVVIQPNPIQQQKWRLQPRPNSSSSSQTSSFTWSVLHPRPIMQAPQMPRQSSSFISGVDLLQPGRLSRPCWPISMPR